MATPFVPAAGLGAALAALPRPWMVFRKGGFSSFEQPGEIYGGIYIALHPEKGIVLADMVPAQPALAIPRLRALLHQTGLTAFAEDDPPIVALALTRGELSNLATRLDDVFGAAPPCRIADAGWIASAVSALAARFPYLRPVLRLEGGALSLEPVAEIPAAITPRAHALTRATNIPVPDFAHRSVRSGTRYRRTEEQRPSRAGRFALGGAAAALALAALALLPRYARDLMSSEPPTPSFSAQIVPPPPVPLQVPETTAVSPMKDDLLPPWSSPKSPAVAPKEDAAIDNAVPPPKPTPPARPAKRKENARPTRTAEKEPAAAVVPAEAGAKAQAAEQKPKKGVKPTQTAVARPDRPRRAELGPPALDNTISVDGLTYIKGREPHGLESETQGLDSTTVPVTDASAVDAPASGTPPSTALSIDPTTGTGHGAAPYSQQ